MDVTTLCQCSRLSPQLRLDADMTQERRTDERRLEIIRLLDAHFRLREDPDRRPELEATRARLRDELVRLGDQDRYGLGGMAASKTES